MKSWFTARAAQSDGEAEIAIYDEIGAFGITAKDFHSELRALGPVAHINLRINSPGGSVFDGLAIFNMLARHKATVIVTVDGIAASIASVIAMAGDAVIMPQNALLMIHDPSGLVVGTSKEMRDLADALDKIKGSLIAAYASKSGMERDEIAQLMADETWLNADEAVEMGFADSVEEPVKMAARFDLSKFKNAPEAVTPPDADAAPAAPSCQEESSMTDTPKTGAAEAETAVAATTETKPEAAATVADTARHPTASEVEAHVRKEVSDIIAACNLAGKPDKASEFIANGKSLSDVVAALQTERATATTPEVSPRKPNPEKAPAVIDTTAVWDKWNGRSARA